MNPGQSIFLLPFANDDELAVGILVRFDDFVEGRDFDTVDGDRTVGDVFAGLAFRFVNLGIDEPVDDVFIFVGNVDSRHLAEGLFQFAFRQVGDAAVVQGFRDVLGFLQGFRAVDESRYFFSQAALGQSFFRFVFDRFGQGVDLLHGEKWVVFKLF